MSDNIIQVNKDLIHTELKNLVKNSIEGYHSWGRASKSGSVRKILFAP